MSSPINLIKLRHRTYIPSLLKDIFQKYSIIEYIDTQLDIIFKKVFVEVGA